MRYSPFFILVNFNIKYMPGYWICWVITLFMYIIAFSIGSCKYRRHCGMSVKEARLDPNSRDKIPIKLYHFIIFFILLWVPYGCLISGIISFIVFLPDPDWNEFLMPEENKLINFLYKIGNLLNKNVAWNINSVIFLYI